MNSRTAILRTSAAAAALAAVTWTASPASAAPSTASSPGPAVTAAAQPAVTGSAQFTPVGGSRAAVNPECVLSWIPDSTGQNVNAHISTFLLHRHNIRAVKVNAQIKCRRVSMALFLQVTLWKTGFIFPHKVAGPTTSTLPKGNLIKNQKTWKQCANRTVSTYYGTSYGQVVFQGVTYTASLQTPRKVPLDCGT